MCNPDNVAELAGTMDSTGVAAQQNPSLLSETDWPGGTEIHFKTRRQLCNKAVQQQCGRSGGIRVILGY